MKLYWVFSTFAVGGPQRRFATLVSALGRDYRHIVSAMDGNYDAKALIDPAVDWSIAELYVQKTNFVSLKNTAVFRRTLAETKPDILLTSNWGTIEWQLANRGKVAVPHIHFEDGFGPDEAHGRWNRKRDLARRVLFAGGRRDQRQFVCPSTILEKRFTEDWGVPADQVHLIPNGVDLQAFTAPSREGTGPVIGTLGSLRREKRIDRLIDVFAAFRKTRQGRLLIIGDGPERRRLEEHAARSGYVNDIEFAGATDDAAAALSRMTLFALTSDTEQMPISVIEAMASGLPVISTDVGDVKAMVASKNQPFVHDIADIDGLVASLAALTDNADLARRVGGANREVAARNYSLKQMVGAYRDLFAAIRQHA